MCCNSVTLVSSLQAEKAFVLAHQEHSVFLPVPGMCMLISWLPATSPCAGAGPACLALWKCYLGPWSDRGSTVSLRLLLFNATSIMAGEFQVFWWGWGKTNGPNSDHISLINSGHCLKTSGGQFRECTVETEQSANQTQRWFSLIICPFRQKFHFSPAYQFASHVLIPVITLSALQALPNEALMVCRLLKTQSARRTRPLHEALSSVPGSVAVFSFALL